ncbi:hypothetical protein ACLI1A_04040 [Flavobacterium sp. RHBU_3]|uniref:hypothetical protein n=1 Tax=Flavobacterium sp. RHBU_3 TaxID=3391184 RepID=UPI00398485AE
MKTKLIRNTQLLLFFEAIIFLLGLLLVIEPVAGIYYYFLWFGIVCMANLVVIVRLIMKKPKTYIGYCISLFILPIIAATILWFVIELMVG